MKTTGNISLYELMADDMSIWIKRNPKFGFDLEIQDGYGEPVCFEEGVHVYAMDALYDFCKGYLLSYEKALQDVAA